jgi:hypothetical protein
LDAYEICMYIFFAWKTEKVESLTIESGLPYLSWYNIPKRGKMYIPNGR